MFPQSIISTRSQTILINTYITTKMNQVFTFSEALEASKIYFDGDELAAKGCTKTETKEKTEITKRKVENNMEVKMNKEIRY